MSPFRPPLRIRRRTRFIPSSPTVMTTTPLPTIRRLGLRAFFNARALLAVSVLAALAVPTRSIAQTPTFNALIQSPIAVGSGFPDDVTVGDINGDGKLDVMAPGTNGLLRVLLGNGDGTFVDHAVAVADVTAG